MVQVTCSECGTVAAKLELLPQGSADPRALRGPTICVEGFIGANRTLVPPDRVSRLERLLAAADWPALFAHDRELAPFFCPDCRAAYCANEWRVTQVFDDEDPNWLDCTKGTCPRGHTRILFD